MAFCFKINFWARSSGVEQEPFKLCVVGSIPTGPSTKNRKYLLAIFYNKNKIE